MSSLKKIRNEGSEKKRRKVVSQEGKLLAEFPEGMRNDRRFLQESQKRTEEADF
jgi:hypothetical protein